MYIKAFKKNLFTIYIHIYIVKRFSNPRKEGTPYDGDGKRK